VEVSTFGHVCEEGVESKRAGGFGNVEGASSAGFLRGGGLGKDDGRRGTEEEKNRIAQEGGF